MELTPMTLEMKAKGVCCHPCTDGAPCPLVPRAELLPSTCMAEYMCIRFVKVTSPLKLVHTRMQYRSLGPGHDMSDACIADTPMCTLVLGVVSPQRQASHCMGLDCCGILRSSESIRLAGGTSITLPILLYITVKLKCYAVYTTK